MSVPDILRRVDELKPGDLVDLEDDEFADPNGTNETFPFKYVEVEKVERETIICVAVAFLGFNVVGFPPDHVVKVSPLRADGTRQE